MKVLFLILIIIFSFCSQKIEQAEKEKRTLEKPKVIIPERKIPVSLTKFVDWTAKNGNLTKLREVAIPKNDFEIRFWLSGRLETKGLIFKKENEKWTAFEVDLSILEISKLKEKKQITPKSNWDEVWKNLTEAEILTLPDSFELKDYDGDKVEDGFGYIVEINKDSVYRVYEYRNPNWADNQEAKQMVKITKIIAEEFGLEDFYFDKESGQKLTK